MSNKEKKIFIIEAVDSTSKAIHSASQRFEKITDPIKSYDKSVRHLNDSMRPVTQRIESMASASLKTIGVLGAASAGGLTLFAGFEDEMLALKAITGATEEAYKKLWERAKELGRTTRYTARESAEMMRVLSMSGMSVSQVLEASAPTLLLASSGRLPIEQAASIASSVMNAYRKSASDLPMIVDHLSKAALSTDTDVAMLGESMRTAAPTANSFGVSMPGTLAVLMELARNGIKSEMAGTALAGGLKRVAAPPKEAAEALASLKIRKKEVLTDDGKFKDFLGFLKRLDRSNATASHYMKIFGESAGGHLVSLKGVTYKLDESIKNLSESKGTAEKVSAEQESGLGGTFRTLISASEDVILTFTELSGLNKFAQFALEKMTAFNGILSGLDTRWHKLALGIGGAVTGLATFSIALGAASLIFLPMLKIAAFLGISAGALTGILGTVGAIGTIAGAAYLWARPDPEKEVKSENGFPFSKNQDSPWDLAKDYLSITDDTGETKQSLSRFKNLDEWQAKPQKPLFDKDWGKPKQSSLERILGWLPGSDVLHDIAKSLKEPPKAELKVTLESETTKKLRETREVITRLDKNNPSYRFSL